MLLHIAEDQAVSENRNNMSQCVDFFLFTLRRQLPVCSNCNHRKVLKKPGKLLAIVFKKHYNDLQSGIQSPSELASNLYSGDIITQDVRDRGQMTTSTTLERNAILLNAVEQAISSNPQCFQQFMKILDDEPTTKPLRTLLKDTYGVSI